MHLTSDRSPKPKLPFNLSAKEKEERAFELALAKTSYNYMFSYLEPVPISADLPKGEAFTKDYELMVLEVFLPLAKNFEHMLIELLGRELKNDLPKGALAAIKAVEEAYEQLQKDHKSHNPLKYIKEIKDVKELIHALAQVPKELESAISCLNHIPEDLVKLIHGLGKVFREFEEEGFTAFLKNTFYDTLCVSSGRNYLLAQSLDDYEEIISQLSIPQNLRIEHKEWMNDIQQKEIYKEDWYFGYLQTAGFNTTQLKAVQLKQDDHPRTFLLKDFLAKMPVSDAMFQSVIGDKTSTLEEAAKAGLLYACDYSMFINVPGSSLHEMERFPSAPIVLFYWNKNPPKGYPPNGALQPIAIQLGQEHDSEKYPIYTPNDFAKNNDANGCKWQIAKTTVLNASAIQHETVAHLGACHLTIEPMIVATHRQLPKSHPLMILLKPHFRFTLDINNGAIHSLIVPGGVVASVLGTSIEGSGMLIVDAFNKWRFDEQIPTKLFHDRGLDASQPLAFPFRDDTLDLWSAIKSYVHDYLSHYYPGSSSEKNNAVQNDYEVQKWINELVNPKYAAVKGLDGLVETGDESQPYQLTEFTYFVDIVALIIYTASAQHAGVNYAQFPLMSYIPSVSGALYHVPPARSEDIDETEMMKWLPPLDVALYQASFGYLLSGVQYDTLGDYSKNPRFSYFSDPAIAPILAKFQLQLKHIEVEIHKRNQSRPFPYLLQLPSIIPNSISI